MKTKRLLTILAALMLALVMLPKQAFAMQIAAQHGLTFEQLERRLKA